MEPVPQGYPSPSVPRETAQNVTVGKPPILQPSMPCTEFSEVNHTKQGPSLLDRFISSLKESVPQFEAMFREAVKDIRQTAMETFLNHREHAPEPGAPMSYTQHMVNQEIQEASQHGIHGPTVDSPSINYPETAAFEAEISHYGHSYPDHERER